jgi:DNA mismatch repair protein PMS2
VTLTGLFKALPVRRKEFERTAKREYTKALGILNAYALVPASKGDGRAGVRLKVEAIGAGKGG